MLGRVEEGWCACGKGLCPSFVIYDLKGRIQPSIDSCFGAGELLTNLLGKWGRLKKKCVRSKFFKVVLSHFGASNYQLESFENWNLSSCWPARPTNKLSMDSQRIERKICEHFVRECKEIFWRECKEIRDGKHDHRPYDKAPRQ